jgi:hypothetical protein
VFFTSHVYLWQIKNFGFAQGRNLPLLIRRVSARIALPKPMMPCSKFLFLAIISPKNIGERGGGRGGGLKKFSGL